MGTVRPKVTCLPSFFSTIFSSSFRIEFDLGTNLKGQCEILPYTQISIFQDRIQPTAFSSFKDYKKLRESVVTAYMVSENTFLFNLSLTQFKEEMQGTGRPRQRKRKVPTPHPLPRLVLSDCGWPGKQTVRLSKNIL